MKYSRQLVKSSLSAHSWLGIGMAAVLYLIILSGTLVVFHTHIERWEQPLAAEFHEFDAAAVESAFNDYLTTPDNLTPHMYLVFPSDAMPRIKFANEQQGEYRNADGSAGVPAYDDWAHQLSDLHYYLHLPKNIGMILVSAMGVILLALIISGLLAHPSIIKDAFAWRSGSERIYFTDLHNRLSVWGLPFHLMMAFTGAYFGLAGLIILIAAEAFHDGDREAVTRQFFSGDPVVEAQPLQVNIQQPLQYLNANVPDGQLLFMTIHEADSEQRFQEYYVQQPGRLIYSENYRFDMQGNFLNHAGYSDGDLAKQIVYSIYRLHFGNFAGMGSKIVYFLMGLALTVVCVSGINIWLNRRKHEDLLNRLWVAVVWGAPLAITVSAISGVLARWPSVTLFWSVLLAALVLAIIAQPAARFRRQMQLAGILTVFVLLAGYAIQFGLAAAFGAGLLLTCGLLLWALVLAVFVIRSSGAGVGKTG
ncbi:MAG: PepSY domain-containing protein [Saccharospirillaceae bacterium]|nr:PepSY domain-containing protein [Saccharospirillaceae bacterium]MCD8530299.1 PepSY domain-containing protein [Saccharospirillaceae bacterium]